jgi:hypothetical protein
MKEMVQYMISVVVDTQEVRDQMLQKVKYHEAMAEKLTEEAIGAIAGLRELEKVITDPETKKIITDFLSQVDNHGEE